MSEMLNGILLCLIANQVSINVDEEFLLSPWHADILSLRTQRSRVASFVGDKSSWSCKSPPISLLISNCEPDAVMRDATETRQTDRERNGAIRRRILAQLRLCWHLAWFSKKG